jgi:tRNA-dihydrouridine synthase
LHTPEEGLEILQRLTPYPIDFLCIHPRLGVQQYEGTVNLDIFETFYQITHHTIVYSGDINDTDFFLRLQQRFPKIKNWMLGRGILQNPFLAEEIINVAESRRQKAESNPKPLLPQGALSSRRFMGYYNEYAELLCALKGEKIALLALKELWHYFAAFWKLKATELQQLLRINEYQIFIKSNQRLME